MSLPSDPVELAALAKSSFRRFVSCPVCLQIVAGAVTMSCGACFGCFGCVSGHRTASAKNVCFKCNKPIDPVTSGVMDVAADDYLQTWGSREEKEDFLLRSRAECAARTASRFAVSITGTGRKGFRPLVPSEGSSSRDPKQRTLFQVVPQDSKELATPSFPNAPFPKMPTRNKLILKSGAASKKDNPIPTKDYTNKLAVYKLYARELAAKRREADNERRKSSARTVAGEEKVSGGVGNGKQKRAREDGGEEEGEGKVMRVVKAEGGGVGGTEEEG